MTDVGTSKFLLNAQKERGRQITREEQIEQAEREDHEIKNEREQVSAREEHARALEQCECYKEILQLKLRLAGIDAGPRNDTLIPEYCHVRTGHPRYFQALTYLSS
ncbi:hypothetical protein MRX96_035713 [Rhipicephalus microplus]